MSASTGAYLPIGEVTPHARGGRRRCVAEARIALDVVVPKIEDLIVHRELIHAMESPWEGAAKG
jgi:hypothetical protein